MKNNEDINHVWNIAFFYFFGVLLIWFFISPMIYGSFLHTSEANEINPDIEEIEVDTVLRCVSYTPIFDKDGSKSYEVTFRSYDYNSIFTCIIKAEEVEIKHNIEKDAKYEGKIKIAYLKEIFESYLKVNNKTDLTDEEKNAELIVFLKSYNNRSFSIAYDAEFMYSKDLELKEKADYINEMIAEANKKVKIKETPFVIIEKHTVSENIEE